MAATAASRAIRIAGHGNQTTGPSELSVDFNTP